MSELERRAWGADLRVSDDGPPRLSGYAAVFRATTEVGGFTEEIAPGAFDHVLGDDVRALFNHDPNQVLGRTKSGTLRLAQDDTGLRYEVDINEADPDAMRVYAQVRRGDVSGSSFAFSVEQDMWDYQRAKPHRTITRMAQLYDVSPVVFPAYDVATVSARALEAAKAEPLPVVVSHELEHKRLDLKVKS